MTKKELIAFLRVYPDDVPIVIKSTDPRDSDEENVNKTGAGELKIPYTLWEIGSIESQKGVKYSNQKGELEKGAVITLGY